MLTDGSLPNERRTGRFTMKKERMIFVPAAFLMTAMLAFPAMASEKIEEVKMCIRDRS